MSTVCTVVCKICLLTFVDCLRDRAISLTAAALRAGLLWWTLRASVLPTLFNTYVKACYKKLNILSIYTIQDIIPIPSNVKYMS